MEDGEVQEALRAHLRACFLERELLEQPGTEQAREAIPDFRVVRLPPRAPGEPWVYASLGAWEATRDDRSGLELVLLSPHESRFHMETLSTCAYFHGF